MTVGLDELQKALDKRPKGKDFKTWSEMAKAQEKWLENFERLFSAFQKDKIVVDRKQLIDLMKRQPFPEAFKWITDFKSQYQHWTKKMKELLEGQK